MTRSLLCLALAVSLGCGRTPTAGPAGPGGTPAAGRSQLAGEWEGEFVLDNAGGVKIPEHMQVRIPTRFGITEDGVVTMSLNGASITHAAEGQLTTNAGGGPNFVASEILKIEKSPTRIFIRTRSRSAFSADLGDAPINDQTDVSDLILTVEGDQMRARTDFADTTRRGPQATLNNLFRRVGRPDAGGAGPATPASDEYYPLAVGTSRTFRVNGNAMTTRVAGEETVAGIRTVRLEMSSGGRAIGSENIQVKPDGYYRVSANGVTYDPPVLFLRATPADGDRWDFETKAGGQVGRGSTSVTAETVTVPAGTFRAFKVRTTVTENGTNVVSDFWFAKGVGVVRQNIQAGPQTLLLELEK